MYIRDRSGVKKWGPPGPHIHIIILGPGSLFYYGDPGSWVPCYDLRDPIMVMFNNVHNLTIFLVYIATQCFYNDNSISD